MFFFSFRSVPLYPSAEFDAESDFAMKHTVNLQIDRLKLNQRQGIAIAPNSGNVHFSKNGRP